MDLHLCSFALFLHSEWTYLEARRCFLQLNKFAHCTKSCKTFDITQCQVANVFFVCCSTLVLAPCHRTSSRTPTRCSWGKFMPTCLAQSLRQLSRRSMCPCLTVASIWFSTACVWLAILCDYVQPVDIVFVLESVLQLYATESADYCMS